MWAALLAFVIPFLRTRWIALDAPIMLALPPVIVATVLARSGSMVPSMAGRVLRGIGLMSYSLYLWQGIFTWYPQTYMARWFAYGSTAGIAIAWLSYRYVEIHFIRLGHQLSRRLQKAVVPAAISVAPQ
jgi:peptidoglycan/LPS O-acetylase OafA/YrhL